MHGHNIVIDVPQTKRILNEEELNTARALLYEYYVEHLNWDIDPNNPSNIRIQQNVNKKMLIDDYDQSADWFSVIKQNKMIACARLCKKDSAGLLEVERYANARSSLKDLLQYKDSMNIVELNREAISPDYLKDKASMLILLKTIFQYCVARNLTLLTTANIPEWVKTYKKITFPKLHNKQFKYCDSEPKPVAVYFATVFDMNKMINKINNFYCQEDEFEYVTTPCFS